MKSGFPRLLESGLLKISDELRKHGQQTEFLYKIADLNVDEVILPDYDVSEWTPLENPTIQRDQGVTWIRTEFIVPEEYMGIPVQGSQLRVMSSRNMMPFAFFAPIDIYIDGKLSLREKSWMDFKCPEAIVTESAQPGTKHVLSMRFDLNEKCYWLNNISVQMICDRIENAIFEIESIIWELKYMESYAGTEPLLAQAYDILSNAAETNEIVALLKAISESRALFEGYRESVKKNKVSLCGHAHIDMNWFWSMEETRQIVKRDFTTMTHLMEKYPDFKFSQSQCATYNFAREDAPEIFSKIQKYEREGRWDITASTWVEGDLNMSQGESIIRHVLYSKGFLKKYFTKEPKIMWCPDTFGHPASIPQILKKTGLDYYYHMRCGLGVGSYEDVHAGSGMMDYLLDSKQTPVYWWKGLDGTKVLVCNTIYNRSIDTRGILRASKRMNEFGVKHAMLAYGVGDHGGGPTERDILTVQRLRTYPTIPDILFSTSQEYYAEIEAGQYDLPVREGEMNFVFDGCYTTHADIKRQNRLCEMGLMGVEKLYSILAEFGIEYPYERLRGYWQKTLFNQFHDILDGSGVKDTYRFTHEEAKKVMDGIEALTEEGLSFLAQKYGVQGEKSYLIFNPTGFERDETISIPIEEGKKYSAQSLDGQILPCQCDGTTAKIFVDHIPGSGFKTITLQEADEFPIRYVDENEKYYNITTPFYEIEICKANGQITTLYDIKRNWYVVEREAIGWRLKKGVLNCLQVHMEEPTEMAGWTIGNVRTIHNLLCGAASEIISDGKAEIRIRFHHEFMSSAIEQDIIIHPNQPGIFFETHVDWNEWGNFDRDAPMLRAYFAPDVTPDGKATYEIPFGTIERPCTDNEYPSLGWVDISDGAHGFAVLDDCKYGHKCRGNAMELTLIRSGWLPDQKSDVGHHDFTYAILPHSGDWKQGKIIAAGQAMNQRPLVTACLGSEPAEGSFAAVEGAVLSNIKRAESGDGVILRVFQPAGEAAKVKITMKKRIRRAEELDMLERPIGEMVAEGDSLQFVLNPYEIKTIKVFDQ